MCYMCLQKILPPCACRNLFADFPKSATGQLPKLPTMCLLEISYPPPLFADFPKSATGQIPTCAYRNSPQWGADFPKSATGQLPKLPTCACRNSPPVCRFSKICHWTVTYMCLQKFPPGCRFSKIFHWTVT